MSHCDTCQSSHLRGHGLRLIRLSRRHVRSYYYPCDAPVLLYTAHNMKLFLLQRHVSEYTAHEMLLGCFTTRSKAQYARRKYISQYKSGKKQDPWEKQAFHEVDLSRDVKIVDNLPVVDVTPNSNEVYIVSHFSEGFGQTRRIFYAICGTREATQEKSHECNEQLFTWFPHHLQVDKINLDQLLPDDKQGER
jgi:hypothetical protein